MANQKVQNVDNGKEFWIGLGREIGESKECAKALADKIEKFMANDHAHLVADVKELRGDFHKLALKIAYIVGGITALSWVIQIIAKIWK